MADPMLPPTPGTGCCLCGAAYYFERGTRAGDRGRFHCRACGRRYALDAAGWTPGRRAPDEGSVDSQDERSPAVTRRDR